MLGDHRTLPTLRGQNSGTLLFDFFTCSFSFFMLHFPLTVFLVINFWLEWVDFPGGSDGEASAYNAGGPVSVSGSGRSPGEGNGTPLQYSRLENPVDGGAWWAADHGVAESQTGLSGGAFFLSSFGVELLCNVGSFYCTAEGISSPCTCVPSFSGSPPHWGHQRALRRGPCAVPQGLLCACAQSCLTLQRHGLQPASPLCPWDFLGMSPGVGCHSLLQGNLPDPGIEPQLLASPALAVWFCTTSSTWEAQVLISHLFYTHISSVCTSVFHLLLKVSVQNKYFLFWRPNLTHLYQGVFHTSSCYQQSGNILF